ncbi:MAG: hypothetical protein SFU98_08360 [Leptospiraceae bacterium]|nr:hypothetical protein [Leptospiraceae bacterium]
MKNIQFELGFFLVLCLSVGTLGVYYYRHEKIVKLESEYSYALKLYKLGEREKAKKVFEHVYKKDSNFSDVSLHLGKINFFSEEFKEAYNILKSGYKENPTKIQYLYWLIKSGFLSGIDKEELKELVSEYLKIDSNNPEILYISGVLEEKSGRLDLALASYEESISRLSNFIPTAARLSSIYEKAGMKSKSNWYSELETRLRSFSKEKKL